MAIRNLATDMHKGPTIAVLMVGGHSGVRDGLRKLLEQERGLTVIGDASDPEDAVRFAQAVKPLILVVGFSGRPLVRMMRSLQEFVAAGHNGRTIVLTTASHRTDMPATLQSGAPGIVLKHASRRELLPAVRSIAAAERALGRPALSAAATMPPNFADAVGAPADLAAYRLPRPELEPPAGSAGFGLTPRELDIVWAVRRGDSNKVIARQFSIAENTVKHHLTRVFYKTGVLSRLELAVFAIKNGLAPDAVAV